MSKNITIIGINYFPEDSAIGLYTTEKAEYLVSRGYNVTVVTGFPYYPQWEIQNEYKNKRYLIEETINGVRVLRSKQYVPKSPTFVKRIIHLISFTFGNLINLFKLSKPDIVISIIPFTTSSLLAWLIKLRYNSKSWIHIQDFEFDAAIDSGLLKGNKKAFIKALLWVERKVLEKADVVSTISYGMINKLKEKVNVKAYYLTNWVDVSLFKPELKINHSYLSSNKFKILYSGNIGAKQDWDFFFTFLKALNNPNNIEVVVVGEGAEKERVVKDLEKYMFTTHYKLVPFKELPLLLKSSDLHILFQKPDVIDTVMPSKLLGMMASGKPSIVTGNVNSEVAKIYAESKGGYYFDGNSIDQIINSVMSLKSDVALRKELGVNAQKYVNEKYSKEKVLAGFVKELEQL